MRAWDQLIESRIRDWQQRQRRGETRPAEPPVPVQSLENQLFAEVVALRRRADAEVDQVAKRSLLDQADQLRIRLSILLEKHGLRSLARSLDERIAAELQRV